MEQPTSSKFNIRLPLIFAALVAFGMFVGTKLPVYDRHMAFLKNSNAGAARLGGTLEELIGYINARYVDSTNTDDLKRRAINEFLKGLDPHSVYISRDELEAVNEDMQGEFDGIGIEFLVVEDTIQVVTPLAGGPSEAAGILAGDRIVFINDTLVAGVKIDNPLIFKKLRGKKGSPVKLSIRRGNEKSLREFHIKRDAIAIHSVDVAYRISENTAYVKINKFSATTYKEFVESLQPLASDSKPIDLILDLRGNPGGYLEQATDVLSQFFPEGKLLVYTEGRVDKREDYKSSGRQHFIINKLAVLIDEGSASAAEIVAGAVQDHDRGWLLGRRSFGKGLVQEQYPLNDGGAIRLTVARYFTPSGRCIQKDYKHDRDHYADDYENRIKNGELNDASKIKIADSTAFYTAGGRKVFAGGGIIPDVFIPLDTSYFNQYYADVRQSVLAQFAQKLIDSKRISQTTDLNDFIDHFSVNDGLLDELVAYAERQNIRKNTAQFSRCKHELAVQLKARLAKLLFKEEGLFSVLNHDDPAVEKALSILKKSESIAPVKN